MAGVGGIIVHHLELIGVDADDIAVVDASLDGQFVAVDINAVQTLQILGKPGRTPARKTAVMARNAIVFHNIVIVDLAPNREVRDDL